MEAFKSMHSSTGNNAREEGGTNNGTKEKDESHKKIQPN